MRYYPRMGGIEVSAYKLFRYDRPDGATMTSPLIDWGWSVAKQRLGRETRRRERRRKEKNSGQLPDPQVPPGWPAEQDRDLFERIWRSTLFFAHLMFPHVIALLAGTALFIAGLAGAFGPI